MQLERRRRVEGQILVIAVIGILTMIGGAALILEGGNAYAQQRVVQNGADAAANAGAVTLAQRLAGTIKLDADVSNSVTAVATANNITSFVARYTNVSGQYLNTTGTVVAMSSAALVGGGAIPPNTQGVAVAGTRTFPTFLGRAVGFNSFDASADATAVTGRLAGGPYLPVVLPVSVVDCDTNGSLGSVAAGDWTLSQPDGTDPPYTTDGWPDGPEYIVPLCKTGGGSFQILDLDPSQRCDDEVANPPAIEWLTLPVDVPSDNGNNCAKPIEEWVNANMVGQVVQIPICDNTVGSDPCGTSGGSRATYRITRVASFVIDYMSDTNNRNNPLCQNHISATSGQALQTIVGNGSSSCLVGWFVKYVDEGPVGLGAVTETDSIGIQLIR